MKSTEENKSPQDVLFILYPKNDGVSKNGGLEMPGPCYTDSIPSIGDSNDS